MVLGKLNLLQKLESNSSLSFYSSGLSFIEI